MSYIKLMPYVQVLKILQIPFNVCKQTRATQPGNSVSQEVSCNMLDVVEKCDHFLICFLKNIRYFGKRQLLQQYLNNQENVSKTSHTLR